MSDPAISAFPNDGKWANGHPERGLMIVEYYAAQALANPNLCTGTAPEWQLAAWFGGRTGITKYEIAARQAWEHAHAMLTQKPKRL